MAVKGEMDRAMGTAQEMVERQRASYAAVADNAVAFQRRSMDLAQDGLRLVELQQDNLKAAQDWWASGLRLLDRQQRSARFAQEWFERSYRVAQDQVEQNFRTAEAVSGSIRQQQEGLRDLAEAWVGAYRSFYSPFMAYAERSLDAAQEVTERGIQATQEATEQGLRLAERSADQAGKVARRAELETSVKGALGVADYSELNVDEVTKKLDGLTEKQLKDLKEYEKQTENRETLIRQIDRKLRAVS